MRSDKNCSPGNRQTQTCSSDCQMEKHDSSLQRTRLHCSRVEWWRALRHCIRRFALHLVMYGLDAAARPWKPIPRSSLRAVLELIWRPHEVWRSVAIDSAENWQPYYAHYAPQHPLTPLCHFTWLTTLWLSCCCSQSLPLCYSTNDSCLEYLVARTFHDWTCCTGAILSRYHAGIHWAPILSQIFVEAVCMPRCLNYILHYYIIYIIMHPWPCKWLENLNLIIWMVEWIILAI